MPKIRRTKPQRHVGCLTIDVVYTYPTQTLDDVAEEISKILPSELHLSTDTKIEILSVYADYLKDG